MKIKSWWKLTFELDKKLEEIIIWKLYELKIFSFAFNFKKDEMEIFLLNVWLPQEHWNEESRKNLEDKLSDLFRKNRFPGKRFYWESIKE